MACNHGRHGECGAVERYHRWLYAETGIEQQAGKMSVRGASSMSHVELFGICLGVEDKFGKVSGREVLVRHDKKRVQGDDANRREVGIRPVSKVRIKSERSSVGSIMS